MNLFSFIIFVLVFIGNAAAQNCIAEIRLYSNIDSVEFFINNKFAGYGPVLSTRHAMGSVIVSAKESGKNWSSVTISDTLSITDCGTYEKRFFFPGRQYLETNSHNRIVFSKDSLIDLAPLYLEQSSDISLVKDRYKHMKLAPGNPGNPVNMEGVSPYDEQRFYEKPLFKYLLGGILVFGGTTAYYKIRADNKYDEFVNTGNPALIDEIRRYDTISGIAFAALQINFGILLYYFLSE